MIERIKKLVDIKLEKGWHWLIYFDIVLPLILFITAYFLANTSVGPLLAKLFHSYNLFLIDPIPEPTKLIGIIGALAHIFFIAYAIKRKDSRDISICVSLTILAVLYFAFEINYKLILYLNFVNL